MVKVSVRRERRGLGRSESRALIIKAVRSTLKAEGVACDCEVSVMLTDGEGIRSINAEMRDKDSITDVLSFPFADMEAGCFDEDVCELNPETGCYYLGDMVICVPRCEEQADEYGHDYARELSYLTVHSVLHLLGYDHEDEAEGKRAMRAREKEIMSEIERDKGTVR